MQDDDFEFDALELKEVSTVNVQGGDKYNQVARTEEEADDEDEEDADAASALKSTLSKIPFGIIAMVFAIILLLLANLALVAVFAESIAFYTMFRPKYTGTVKIGNYPTMGDITFNRELSGILHIEATTNKATFFGQGYAHASERLYQMEFNKLVYKGKLSSKFGNTYLDVDKFFTALDIYGAAEASVTSTLSNNPTLLSYLTAYADGVNTFISQASSSSFYSLQMFISGISTTTFTVADSVAMLKFYALQRDGNVFQELARFQAVELGLSSSRINALFPAYSEVTYPTILSTADLQKEGLDAAYTAGSNTAGTLNDYDQLAYDVLNTAAGTSTADAPLKGDNIAQLLQDLNSKLPFNMFQSETSGISVVYNGNFTKSGNPIHYNDLHSSTSAPSTFMQMHLMTNDSAINAIGASFPGIPGILSGRNDQFSWGIGSAQVDNQDLYYLNVSSNGTQYKYKGGYQTFNVTTTSIDSVSRPYSATSTVSFTYRKSLYGPVLFSSEKFALSLMWTGLSENDTSVFCFMNLVTAKSFVDYQTSIDYLIAPALGVTYADINNTIAYHTVGRIPYRNNNHTGNFPVPGAGDFDWLGYIPRTSLPHVINPSTGMIVTAGNKINPSGVYTYPLNFGGSEGLAAKRLSQILLKNISANSNLVYTDILPFGNDVYNPLLYIFTRVWQNMFPEDAKSNNWRSKVLLWNGQMNSASAEAAVFAAWFAEVSNLPYNELKIKNWGTVYPDYVSNTLSSALTVPQDTNCAAWYGNITCNDYAANALKNSLRYALHNNPNDLQQLFKESSLMDPAFFEYGFKSDSWNSDLQKLYTWYFRGLLNRDLNDKFVWASRDGGYYSVNVNKYDIESFASTKVSTWKSVTDMVSNVTDLYFSMPMGQSGHPMSSYYDNWFRTWMSDGDFQHLTTASYSTKYTQTWTYQP